MGKLSKTKRLVRLLFLRANLGLLLSMVLPLSTRASENVPYRPFAQWADVPDRGQFIAGAVYEQADSYVFWAEDRHETPQTSSLVHINQGFISLQYGITERWAADLNFGFTKGTFQDLKGSESRSTSGLMDLALGVRYQLYNEAQGYSPWLPTATFRAGAVIPGSYDQNFPFSPGLNSVAIEPELLVRKHFAWTGFGGYGDGLYRWNRTTATDQYIVALGLFQQLSGWELDLGWRHLQTLDGESIVVFNDGTISYPRDVRENSDSIEAGVSYTTPARHNRYGAQVRAVLDGNNADEKFWFGFSVDIPFGGNTAR